MIEEICPKFQVLSPHFSEINDTRAMSNEPLANIVQKGETISTPIYVECENMYQQNIVVKNSGKSCLALRFDLSNPKMEIQHAKNLFKVERHDNAYTFFSLDGLRRVKVS